jgi:hypothetical protein
LACAQALPQVWQVPLVALNALANFLGALLTCVEIGFDLLPMT